MASLKALGWDCCEYADAAPGIQAATTPFLNNQISKFQTPNLN